MSENPQDQYPPPPPGAYPSPPIYTGEIVPPASYGAPPPPPGYGAFPPSYGAPQPAFPPHPNMGPPQPQYEPGPLGTSGHYRPNPHPGFNWEANPATFSAQSLGSAGQPYAPRGSFRGMWIAPGWRRFGAMLIDYNLTLTLPLMILPNKWGWMLAAVLTMVNSGAAASDFGQSLGKKVFNIYMVQSIPIGNGEAICRKVPEFVAYIRPFFHVIDSFCWLGVFMLFLHRNKITVADRICKTMHFVGPLPFDPPSAKEVRGFPEWYPTA